MTKQAPTTCKLPARRAGESDRSYFRKVSAFLFGEDVRTKTDLCDWTGSLPFHLNRESEKKT